MRKKIKFVGFWEEWNPEKNFITDILKKYVDIELSDTPDILFSSCFSDEYMEYDCPRVFFTGENLVPNFNYFDFAIGFEYMQYGDRYFRYPLYFVDDLYGADFKLMQKKHTDLQDVLAKKTEFCSFVVSNGTSSASDVRKMFYDKLSKYKKVNSGGRYLNNIGIPEGVDDKLKFQSKHKFSIAFENSSHPGYTTEKLVQAFAAKTIPIYWGNPCISKEFNSRAFINCHDYNSFDDVVDIVKKIDGDDDLYLKMLSEPALQECNSKEYMDRELDAFLRNIILSSGDSLYRANRLRFGRAYFDEIRYKEELTKKMSCRAVRLAIKFDDAFKKLLFQKA